MNLRQMTLGLAAVVTLGTSSAAFAAPPDVSSRQLQVKDAITVFDLGLTQDRIAHIDGRKDLVMVSSRSRTSVEAAFKTAYRQERTLPNGYYVAGWGKLTKTGATTFTLKNAAGDRMVAEVFDAGGKTQIKLWGVVRKENPPQKSRDNLPRRYAPAGR